MAAERAVSKTEFGLVTSRSYFEYLVGEAVEKRQLQGFPRLEKYLVDLLEHFLDARNLHDYTAGDGVTLQEGPAKKPPSTLAELYLTAMQSDSVQRADLFKKLGDRSLYISGFFGDSLNRKMVDLDYYVNLGGSAYGHLSELVSDASASNVYKIFSKRFTDFVDVLAYISQQSFIKSDQSILRLYERYIRTGSEMAREKLVELGVVHLSTDQISLTRQD